MLTYDDAPIIKNAVERRLDKEPGVESSWVDMAPVLTENPPFIHVVVSAYCGPLLGLVTGMFHLPIPWEYAHLQNQIDEIAEGIKKARRDFFRNGMELKGLK